MPLRRLRTSTRLLLGGLAAALGFGAVTAEVVSASAEPTTGDHTTAADPASMGVASTLESCTAMFGLNKANSDLAKFDLSQTGLEPITPPPVIGTDLVPVITVSDGTTTHECVVVPGWTDETTYTVDYMQSIAWAFAGSVPYPGTGYFIIPAIDGWPLQYHGSTPFTPTSRTLRFDGTLPSGHSLTWSPVQPVALQTPLVTDTIPTVADLSGTFYGRVFTAVQTTGDLAQRNYLEASLVANLTPTAPYCSDSDATFIALMATLNTLMGTMPGPVTSCGDIDHAAAMIGREQLLAAEFSQTTIAVTIAGPQPTTTTTAPAEPVAPTFAG